LSIYDQLNPETLTIDFKIMKPLFFRCLIIALLFSGCQNDADDIVDTPTQTALVTVLATSFDTSSSDDWVMAHDQDGNLLAFKSFENNSTTTLYSDNDVSGNIGITFLHISSLSGMSYYQLNSYLDVEKGKEIVVQTQMPASWGSFLGSFYVRVTGATTPDQHALSSAIGKLDDGAGLPGTITFNGSIYSKDTKFLVQASDGSTSRYKFLENVKPSDVVDVSFNDMLEFDKVVEFNFPETTNVKLTVNAFDDDPALQAFGFFGFRLSNHFRNDLHSKIQAGYINSLTNYETSLVANYGSYAYQYSNYGSIPDPNIAWPAKSNFTVNNTSVNNFSATTTAPFVRRLSRWASANNSVLWTVLTPSNEHTFVAIPAEITANHPLLAFDNFAHQSTSFVTKGTSYEEYIDSLFDGKVNSSTEAVAITLY
jgi:hypothetical protein